MITTEGGQAERGEEDALTATGMPAQRIAELAARARLTPHAKLAVGAGPAPDAGPPAEEPATATTSDSIKEVTVPGPGETVSFEANIKPLFREHDRKSMSFALDLWSEADVQAHAAGILQRLQDGTMPCDGAWPQDRVAAFQRWTESGQRD